MVASYSRFRDVTPLTTADWRLRGVLALLNDDSRAVEDIARSMGVRRGTPYEWLRRCLEALTDHPPGPAPGWRDNQRLQQQLVDAQDRIQQLEDQNRRLQEQLNRSVEVTRRRLDRMELVLTRHCVSLRGIQQILQVAYDHAGKTRLASLQKRIKARCRLAGSLLDRTTLQVAPHIRCVAADDVYFHRKPIKVAIEPRSVAILRIGRWTGQAAEDWALWLSVFPALLVLVSDLATDLVGAARIAAEAHQADLFHEARWFTKKLFEPLSRREERLRAAALAAWTGATRPFGPGKRIQKATVEAADTAADAAEAAFFTAMEAVDAVWGLFRAQNPATGQLWTAGEQAAVLSRAQTALRGLGLRCTDRAARHLKAHGSRYSAHLRMWDTIAVVLRPGSRWTRQALLDGLLQRFRWDRTLARLAVEGPSDAWRSLSKKRARLARRLESGCLNLAAVERAVRRELAYPKRSSSAVESLNSRLRVVQMVHRNVSDALLELHALAWNLTPRRLPGRRQGRSPYQMLEQELGIELGLDARPWYDRLLDEEAARRTPPPAERVTLQLLPEEASPIAETVVRKPTRLDRAA